MSERQYNSIFTNEINIDIANYLTELLISNRLGWLKKPKPRCAFWRKDIYEKDASLKELAKIYGVEIIGVKQLLSIFSATVLADYFTEKHSVGFKTIKKINQERTIIDLYDRQLKYNKTLDKQPSIKLDDKEYGGSPSLNKNNTMSLLHGED